MKVARSIRCLRYENSFGARNGSKRAQISIEILFFTGIFLLAISVISVFAARETTNRVSQQAAQDAVTSIIRAADNVYLLGPGSVEYVTITIPGGFVAAGLQGRSVSIILHLYGEDSDFHARGLAPLIGELPQQKGTFRIKLSALDTGEVEIEQAY